MEQFEVKYEKRLVAFIDVMGFKELLKPEPFNQNQLSRYYNTAFKYLEEKESLYLKNAEDDKFTNIFVSDSIILSVVLSGNATNDFLKAGRLISTISELQYRLATHASVWTRGALSIGDLCIDSQKNVLVGPAFVQAYELERLANYPRVIIDPRVIKEFSMTSDKFVEEMRSSVYRSWLIGTNVQPLWRQSDFKNDAIQIDWFSYAFHDLVDLNPFFMDIIKRQYSNQELFIKSEFLVRYLIESHSRYRSEFFVKVANNDTLKNRNNEIARHLAALSSAVNVNELLI
ncbi:hypothetical protein [Bdellovibrio sp. HCB-162]|uniref:hypothetical protein n=1 Tax=Bdellovibrio sp. HCB-162 TaxID=3394234 RepID=UPI0039BD4C82